MQRGKLIKLPHPERDRTTKLNVIYENTLEALYSTKAANEFLQKIRSEKPKYIRDQLTLILNIVKGADEDIIKKSIEYCIKRSLYSAVSFKDTTLFMLDKYKEEKNTSIPGNYKDITTEIRDVKEYVEALGGQCKMNKIETIKEYTKELKLYSTAENVEKIIEEAEIEQSSYYSFLIKVI